MKLFRRSRDVIDGAVDDLADWPAEISATHGRPPAGAIGDANPIWDRMVYQATGATGGPEDLFAAIDRKLSADTRAWTRHQTPAGTTEPSRALPGSTARVSAGSTTNPDAAAEIAGVRAGDSDGTQ